MDMYHRTNWEAWRYFEDTIGLDLREVNKRWLLIQPIFIPEHVSNTYGATIPHR